MAFTRSGVRSPSAPLQREGDFPFLFHFLRNLPKQHCVKSSGWKYRMQRLKRTVQRLLIIVPTAGLLISNCKKDEGIVGPDGSPSDVIFPTSNVSYTQHVQRLFNQTCALPSCHIGNDIGDRVKLDSYQNLMFGSGSPPIPVVRPGSPETSILVFRIEGRTAQRMPPNTTNPLNQNQINGIRAWIAEGAREN